MAMKVGELYGVLTLEKSKFDKGIKGSKLSFGSLVNAVKLGSVIAIAAVAAIGAAAVKMGLDYQNAVNTIRTGTGATGEDLAALTESMNTVARTVPEDLGTIAQVIADVNTRTGATGRKLEGLTANLLALARVSGQDVNPLVASSTRLFGDWGIKTKDQAETLDKVWRASQNTGIGVDELMTKVVQFGSPLRLLGLDLDETLALFGLWEQTGVNTETAMAGLKMAVGNLSENLKPGQTVAGQFEKQLRQIETAADPIGAAIDLFGKRAGPDLAAAILEGKFEVDDLVDIIENGDETIMKAAEDTQTFGDLFGIAMNNLSVAVGENVMPVLMELLRWVQEQMPTITAIFTEVGTAVGQAFSDTATAIRPLIQQILPILKQLFETFTTVILPKLIELFTWLNTNVMPIIIRMMGFIVNAVKKVIEVFGTIAEVAGPAVGEILDWISEDVAPVFEEMFNTISEEVIPALEDAFNNIADVVGPALGAAIDWLSKTILPALKAAFNIITTVVVPALKGAFEGAVTLIQRIWPYVQTVVETVGTAVGIALDAMGTVFETVKTTIAGAYNGIKNTWSGIVSFFKNLFDRIVSTVKGPINSLIGLWNELDLAIPSFNLQIIPPGSFDIPNPLGGYLAQITWDGVNFKFPGTDDLIPDIPKLAKGTNFWRGGIAMLGEVGPELAYLPRGTQVSTAGETRDLMERLGKRSDSPAIGTQNIYGIMPDEVERQTRRALRRQALDWSFEGR